MRTPATPNPVCPDPVGAAPSATINPPAAVPERLALSAPAAHVRFWLVVIGGMALDLWSKEWAFTTLRQGGHRNLIAKVLEFHTTMNTGALFGIGAGQTALFVIASLVALALVLWMFAQCPARRWFSQIALAAILAGALGNMYDRVFVRLTPYVFQTGVGPARLYCEIARRSDGSILLTEYPPNERSMRAELPPALAADLEPAAGCVRDFIRISQQWFGGRNVWPWVFNVADMLLVGGVGVLAIRLFSERKPQPAPAQETLDASTGRT